MIAAVLWTGAATVGLGADHAPRPPADMESLMIAAIYAGARAWRVDPVLMLEVCERESDLRWWAVGDFKERHGVETPTSFGICGVKATTASAITGRIVTGWELIDPGFNANVAARIFRECFDQYNGNRGQAVDCYRGVKPALSAGRLQRRKDDKTRWILTRVGEAHLDLWMNGGGLRMVRK